MSLFRFIKPSPEISGQGLILRSPRLEDFHEWAELRDKSRAHLMPWEPVWPENDLTISAYRQRVRRSHQDEKEDLAYSFFIFDESHDILLGGVTFGHVRRGASQACSLGYWIGAPYANQGWMGRALVTGLNTIFTQVGLRRVEAASLPHNLASRRVLEKAGFKQEGFAKEYLCIAGKWHDHVLYSIRASEFLSAQNNSG